MSVEVSDLGAELQSIKAFDGTEYLWQGNEEYWARRAPNLFPFVARLCDGKYTIDGNTYSMSIHGFTKSSRFAAAENGGKLAFVMTDNEETYLQYPRHFRLSIIYELCGKRLNIRFKVDNLDDKVMYFGLGGHPGFNVPLRDGLNFTDYSIRFDKPCRPRQILFSDRCLVSGETRDFELENGQSIPLRHELFDDDAVVLQNMERKLTIASDKDTHSVTVAFSQISNVGFWHMRGTDAPYVCVEPWVSLPANDGELTCFEEKKDMVKLNSGKSYINDWYIEVSF